MEGEVIKDCMKSISPPEKRIVSKATCWNELFVPVRG